MTGDPDATTHHTSLPEPGWYHDDNGLVRWWNGYAWDVDVPSGPAPAAYGAPGYAVPGYAPGGYPGQGPGYGPAYGGGSDGRTMALLAHLGAFVGGFLLPLIILLTTGKTDPFVRHHASESLNFQITYIAFVFGGVLISLVTLGLGLFVFFPLFLIVVVLHIVWAIQGAIAANRGEWFRYPVNLRLVKGAIA